MPHHRSRSKISGVAAASAGLWLARGNVALYWGQNSYNQGSGDLAQQPLATYCANTDIDIIPMAFMVQVTSGQGKEPVINFANQQNNCTVFPDTGLMDCPQIGDDIKTCQQKYGKTILLSIGGATYTEGGFASKDAAIAAANLVWNTFGPTSGSSSTQTYRPFHDAVIDGFDLDLETAVQNFNPFAAQLRSLMDADKSKKYYLTAAPQCPYPDAADDSMLNGAAGMDKVNFDAIFVQFYNNYCGTNSYVANATTQNNFNFETWDNWATTKSANKDVKVFLGVPAGQSAAGTGYLSADALKPVIDYCKTFKSFGGVMAWDASQAYANKGFLDGVKTALGDSSKKARLIRRTLAREWWG
ncbi:glycoside hydrolase family 18 protein [Zasmidium cellare ATCC 36951]|uniref:chitinase n=1 Tax=Zasmidium cellare ATCC 36951 TaxID=1080233 RepID=A0A6A6CWC6_ZASCE|nr:glycoside hydrolase family 18 protein [Zasmidium cellare ATCC 36951]KAF2170500.1 glycoside hydrolase family 18 protein [Zasmidium cellare ATCC 36951]